MLTTVPKNNVPVRVFETYDSYTKFLPLIYHYWEAMGTHFSSICYEDLQQQMPEGFDNFNNHICHQLGFDARISLEEGTPSDFDLQDGLDYGLITSVDLTDYDDSRGTWNYLYEWGACNNMRSSVVVECMDVSGSDCLQDGDQCATDLDCCDQMYCSPISGNCTDAVKLDYMWSFSC